MIPQLRLLKLEVTICDLRELRSQIAASKNKYIMAKAGKELMIPDELVINKIYLIREQKVMLDRHLAELYDVETKVLNQAVRRNSERFPKDFMFQLTKKEWESIRSQFVTLEAGRGKYPKYLPYVLPNRVWLCFLLY